MRPPDLHGACPLRCIFRQHTSAGRLAAIQALPVPALFPMEMLEG